MDIARITTTAGAAPAYPVPSRNRERVLELVSEVDASAKSRAPIERVVQGEVLQRQRSAYSSTQDYLSSRLLDGAVAGDDVSPDRQGRAGAGRSGYAVGAYLSHTRELIQPEFNRGKQVDYFV